MVRVDPRHIRVVERVRAAFDGGDSRSKSVLIGFFGRRLLVAICSILRFSATPQPRYPFPSLRPPTPALWAWWRIRPPALL